MQSHPHILCHIYIRRIEHLYYKVFTANLNLYPLCVLSCGCVQQFIDTCLCVCVCVSVSVSVSVCVCVSQIDHKHFVTVTASGAVKKEEGEEKEQEEGERETEKPESSQQDPQTKSEHEDSLDVMTQLTKFIYNCSSGELGRIRTRAMLCQIYHHALHDRYRM